MVDDECAKASVGNTSPSNSESHRPFPWFPTIPLPYFNGEFNCWFTFRERFSSLVYTCPGLAKIDKFFYSIGCLKDSVADAIRGIPAPLTITS